MADESLPFNEMTCFADQKTKQLKFFGGKRDGFAAAGQRRFLHIENKLAKSKGLASLVVLLHTFHAWRTITEGEVNALFRLKLADDFNPNSRLQQQL